MKLIIDLPEAFCVVILSIWCDAKSLSGVDVAVSEKNGRSKFLENILKHAHMFVNVSNKNQINLKRLSWTLDRGIKINGLEFLSLLQSDISLISGFQNFDFSRLTSLKIDNCFSRYMLLKFINLINASNKLRCLSVREWSEFSEIFFEAKQINFDKFSHLTDLQIEGANINFTPRSFISVVENFSTHCAQIEISRFF